MTIYKRLKSSCVHLVKLPTALLMSICAETASAITTTTADFGEGKVNEMIGGEASTSFNWLRFGLYVCAVLAGITMGVMYWKRESETIVNIGGTFLVILVFLAMVFAMPKKFGFCF